MDDRQRIYDSPTIEGNDAEAKRLREIRDAIADRERAKFAAEKAGEKDTKDKETGR